MRHRAILTLFVVLALGLGAVVHGQGTQSGTLTGVVRDTDGLVIPGATVTITSPAMQGARDAVTDGNGQYIFRGLPPGSYKVVIELSGMKTVENTLDIQLGKNAVLDATLGVATLTETVTVKGEAPSAIINTQVAANYKNETINTLPSARTLDGIASLAPGVTQNTPNAGQVAIAGSFAYDNVFMVDGVDVNDNLFGTANNLFIEDAVEETSVLSAGISAEYGRFSGGVINTITKSGGNKFSGSFRTNLTNPSWTTETPYETSHNITRQSQLSKSYEGTFGGPLQRDRLWFFAAGRYQDTKTEAPLGLTGIPFTTTNTNKRIETKLTGTVAAGHTVQGSFIQNSTNATRMAFGVNTNIDPHTSESPSFPNTLFVANYKGVLSSTVFVEGQYSRKKFGFRDTGGKSTNMVDSPIWSLSEGVLYNAPYFDATDPEDRNNQQFTGSVSYFLSTSKTGTHDFKTGVERFTSSRTGGNSQSATSYVIDADYVSDAAGTPVFGSDGYLIPQFVPGQTYLEHWMATRNATIDITTTSWYGQDRWRFNPKLTFDLGVRYEKVRSKATGGIVGVDTDTWVPRLAASYDVTGKGSFVLQATYAHYAGKYSEAQFAGNTDVANPSEVLAYYTGPAGQGRNFAAGFNPANYQDVFFGSFPTANIQFNKGLHSPVTREFTLQAGGNIGSRGYAKAIYTKRDMKGFVEDFINLSTGMTNVVRDGIDYGTFTNVVYENSDLPQRQYQGLLFYGRYRLTNRWTVDANWTLQLQNEGNFAGEGQNTPGISSPVGDYPEIYSEARHYPLGRLGDYQRNKVRAWTTYDLGLGRLGDAAVSVMYRYDGPTTYSLTGTNVPLSATQELLGAAYTLRGTPLPGTQTIYFGDRGAYFYEAAHLFDLSGNYNIPIWGSLKPWLKVEVYNVLNNDKLLSWNHTVKPDWKGPVDALGLPTTYITGSSYGQATGNGNYARARTFQMSFGIRF